ncbi:PspC domain-containing protein [Paenibacillus sp. sgz500958]|uniref:PspC domain-containing protein n=1 Tax=Paenibacillus sp. sgz500958 TaxID=3242475 RepID=UPI0036D37571
MKKLYRSQVDKKISGLFGGLAIWLGVDATILRLIAVVLVLCSVGSVVFFYILASILVPKEPYGYFSDSYNHY